MSRPPVFLDRDGTINVEVAYLGDPGRLELIPGAAEAIRRLNHSGYAVVVISNQAGVARGYFDALAVDAVNQRLLAELARSGARVDGVYICPHHPEFTGGCECRKPAPGMLLRAAAELDLDLGRAWCVGDKASDIEAGRSAGCRTILVRTGYGAEEAARAAADDVVDDLSAAVAIILEEETVSHHRDTEAQRI